MRIFSMFKIVRQKLDDIIAAAAFLVVLRLIKNFGHNLDHPHSHRNR